MKEGGTSPTPYAEALGRQRPQYGGARQRRLLCVATATPQSRRGNAQRRRRWALPPLRRLKVFSQATAMLPLRRHGVGSRLSLNMEPGADGHPGGSWMCRHIVSGTTRGAWCCCRQDPAARRGGLCREHQGQAGERPPFSTLRARPYEHTFSRCARAENQFLSQRVAGGMAPGGGRRRQGASSIQSQRICLMLPKHMTALRQGVAPRAPEVMLDDAVQAHPGRLHLRRP